MYREELLKIIENNSIHFSSIIKHRRRDIYNYVDSNYEGNSFSGKVYCYLYGNNVCKNEGCNNLTKFINFNKGYRDYCCNRCAQLSSEVRSKIKQTSLEKYGVEHTFQVKDFKEKGKKTKLEKYGDENYNNVDKNKQTCLKRYGVENSSQVREIKEKKKKIYMKRYNVENPSQNTEIKEKKKKTLLKNYGVKNPSNSDVIQQRKRENNLRKYGMSGYNNSEKIKQTNFQKYGVENVLQLSYNRSNKTSKMEIEVCNKLNGEHKFIYENKEFDIKLGNDLIEIDGDFWHPNKLENLTLIQISSVINDKEKIDIIQKSDYNLYKIYISELNNNISLNCIKNNSYIPNYEIDYYQKIISKEYLKDYIEKRGKHKLDYYVNMLLKFVRTFQKEFPHLRRKETIIDITNKINNYDFNNMCENKIFNNNCYDVGINYLKSHFDSYWKSKYKSNGMSPYDAWYDDDIMKEVIKYRIGLNNSGEIFDFSLHQLVRGLAARRFTISFFKPLLAAAIYKHFLGDIDKPTVIDPCAGFGGRMLGFKSIYPNGTYIGIEPNKETYDELIELSKNFSNIKLYNCKLEDYSENKNCDLTFTSVPYFNDEIYSDNKQMSFDEWSGMMNYLINNYKNVLINLSEKVYNLMKFDYDEKYYIKNNRDHFNKTNGYNKRDLLLKI